jgi:hypothetical protein
MRRRLNTAERAELERERDRLRTQLRLLEIELRSDDRLRLADRVREAERSDGRPGGLAGRWREWVR